MYDNLDYAAYVRWTSELGMQGLFSSLFLKLIELEIADGHDAGKLCHLVEEGPQIGEVAVYFDLDRLRHDDVLLGIVTRAEPHYDHPRISSIVLQTLKDIRDLTLFRQQNLELFVFK